MTKIQQTARNHRLQSWKKIIGDCHNSGLSASEYIRQNNISKAKYYYWLRLIREELVTQLPSASQQSLPTQKTTFVPLPIPQVHPVEEKSLLLYCGKFQLQVTEKTSPDLLQMTLSALQAVIK